MSTEEDSNEEINAGTSFTEKGVFKDEVTLKFDDGRELFVSEIFLSMSSPVFEKMFSGDWSEKTERTAQLHEKNYDDFLEFLMCIHPAIQKAVDESNVENIVPIADEYQVPSVIDKCKAFMKTIADRDHEQARCYGGNLSEHIVAIRKCLIFLNIALNFNYQDIIVYLADTLAKYPSPAYMEMNIDTRNYIERAHSDIVKLKEKDIPVQDLHKECLDLFAKLPTEVRLKVASKRLQRREDLRIL